MEASLADDQFLNEVQEDIVEDSLDLEDFAEEQGIDMDHYEART